MRWVKAPDELKAHIENIMQAVECEKRPMFGYPAFFIKKNMFAGLFQDKLFVRLSPDQAVTLKRAYPALGNLEPMPGRPMKDYYVIPEVLHKDTRKMAKVVEDAAVFCRTLPEKAKKPSAKKPIVKKPRKKASS